VCGSFAQVAPLQLYKGLHGMPALRQLQDAGHFTHVQNIIFKIFGGAGGSSVVTGRRPCIDIFQPQ